MTALRTLPPFLAVLAAALAAMLAAGLTAAPGRADPFAGLAQGGTAVVSEVVDGDTVVLADGRQVRLVGIQAPKLPLGRPGFEAWPLAEEAKATLASLTRQGTVTLGFGGVSQDRHGRLLAHMFTEDGVWLQGAMLEQGLARVYSFADNRALVDEMLALERAARAAGRGIWGLDYYALVDEADAGAHLGSFALVEGEVLDAEVVRGRGYLNFGEDWKQDFTVTIAPEDMDAFLAAGMTPDSLEKRYVRVRGWLRSRNGPMIEATHPEQIEVLSR